AAIGGLGAGSRVVGGELDGELVGCVIPLTGSLQLEEPGLESTSTENSPLMLTVAADISAETGTTRVRSSALLLGLRRSSSACTSSVVVSPSTVTDATAEYEPASTSPGIEVSTVISLLQSITSHAPPGSAQPVSSVQAVRVRVVAWKETVASMSSSGSPSYRTGKGSTETGNVWCGSCTRSAR